MFRLLVIGVIAASISLCQVAVGQTNSPSTSASYAPDTPGDSHAALDLRVPGPNPDGWAYPVTQLDQSLPSWVKFGGQFRDRLESQDGIGYSYSGDTYDLTQLRLGIYLQPTSWLELVGVTQDSRVFFNHHVATAPPYQNIWDIREAYLELGSAMEGWFDFIAGREILSFGDERVIGPSDWLNMGRTFDTLRLDLHPSSAKISIFAASVINAIDGQVDRHIEGNNLYGVYASFTHVIPRATLEPYLLWRVAPGNVSLSETEHHGHFSEVTGGARLAGTLHSLDYDAEMNKQTGSLGPDTIDAWGGHWNAGYTFLDSGVKPRIFAEYNYGSGNKNPNSLTWGTHDQLYPSAHDKMDLGDQFGWRNIEDLRIGVDQKASRKWTFTEMMDNLWLATKNDAVYGANGAISVAADPRAASKHLGEELDMLADFKQNRHVTYGLGFAHIFTGAFLNQATHGKDYNYPYLYVTYIF
ncbi:MAG: alginate export family protein [Acidobacteriaceae bacterium]|nr:alginate export family protein [Acidobacteriaceae bacterium]